MLPKRGRPFSFVWDYFDQNKACKSCGFHRHSLRPDRAIKHLKKCSNFINEVHNGHLACPSFLEDEENPSSPSPQPFTAEQQKSFDKAVTKAFVYAGVPFNVLAQKELSEAVKIANPSAKLQLFYTRLLKKRN